MIRFNTVAWCFAVAWLACLHTAAAAQTPAPASLASSSPAPAAEPPRLVLDVPYAPARVGQSLVIRVRVEPPGSRPVQVAFERDANFNFSHQSVVIPPAGEASVEVTAVGLGMDGLPWVRASAAGYAPAYAALNFGFMGHIKVVQTGRLAFEDWSTVTLALVDKDGNPFSTDKLLDILVRSNDAALGKPGASELRLRLLRNANVASFQLRPHRLKGGDIYLDTTVSTDTIPEFSLDAQSLKLQSEPAWWLPLLLAIGGGLIYGIYKAVQPSDPPRSGLGWGALVTSAIGGIIGYLVAYLDLLGLKLDPNTLRSYPLLGFLVAYIGLDLVLQRAGPPKKTD